MKITKDEINHVAALSRLEFGEDEIDKFTEQMGDIIYMAPQFVDRETDFREDKPEHWESRAELMKNVPEKADGFIKVPVIIDKDDNE